MVKLVKALKQSVESVQFPHTKIVRRGVDHKPEMDTASLLPEAALDIWLQRTLRAELLSIVMFWVRIIAVPAVVQLFPIIDQVLSLLIINAELKSVHSAFPVVVIVLETSSAQLEKDSLNRLAMLKYKHVVAEDKRLEDSIHTLLLLTSADWKYIGLLPVKPLDTMDIMLFRLMVIEEDIISPFCPVAVQLLSVMVHALLFVTERVPLRPTPRFRPLTVVLTMLH